MNYTNIPSNMTKTKKLIHSVYNKFSAEGTVAAVVALAATATFQQFS